MTNPSDRNLINYALLQAFKKSQDVLCAAMVEALLDMPPTVQERFVEALELSVQSLLQIDGATLSPHARILKNRLERVIFEIHSLGASE